MYKLHVLYVIYHSRYEGNKESDYIAVHVCTPVQVAERSKGKNSENSDLEKINNVNSTPVHEKTGTRRNALIYRPHSLFELPDLRDSSKPCGLQIGIVEVVYLNDCII